METELSKNEIARAITGNFMDAADLIEVLSTIIENYTYCWLSAEVETHTSKTELREQLYVLNLIVGQLSEKTE